MANFKQWRSRISNSLPKAVWVYGSNNVLKDLVINDIKSFYSDVHPVVLHLEEIKEDDLWNYVYSFELYLFSARIVVVRGADRLRDVDRINDYLDSKISNQQHLIFVSDLEDIPRKPKFGDAKVGEPKNHIKKIQNKGYTVKCDLFDSAILASVFGISLSHAKKIMTISTNPRILRDLVIKVSALDTCDDKILMALNSSPSNLSFVEHLLRREKSKAISLVNSVDGTILNELDYLLGLYFAINSLKDTTSKGSIPDFLIIRYKSIARYYDKSNFNRLKTILASL